MLLNNTIKTNERGTTYSSNSFRENSFIVKRGDIFDVDLGVGIGSEQFSRRPCLVLQNDVGNKYSPTVIIAAITSQIHKAKLPTHVAIESNNENGLEKDSVVLLEQVRVIDKKRLIQKIGRLDKSDIQKVNKALLISIGLIDEVELKQENNKIEEPKKDEFNQNRARLLADKTKECQERISRNTNKNIIHQLLQEKMNYISELKMYCKRFNQDYRFYYNTNSINSTVDINNIERGIRSVAVNG